MILRGSLMSSAALVDVIVDTFNHGGGKYLFEDAGMLPNFFDRNKVGDIKKLLLDRGYPNCAFS